MSAAPSTRRLIKSVGSRGLSGDLGANSKSVQVSRDGPMGSRDPKALYPSGVGGSLFPPGADSEKSKSLGDLKEIYGSGVA